MTAEPLGENTYKITLDKTETSELPQENDRGEMHRFICGLIDRLDEECRFHIPDGRLLAEVFLRSDGSCVIFVTTLEQEPSECEVQYCSCDISGIERLRALCAALAQANAHCAVYCGEEPDSYRLLFADPPPELQRICTEFGDYCEISQLFAFRTDEYLIEISPYGDIRPFAELIG